MKKYTTRKWDLQLFFKAEVWTNWISEPGRGKRCLFFQSVQTDSVAYPTYCSIGNGPSSLGVKQPGREADHSP
jgi:hypothetical protein